MSFFKCSILILFSFPFQNYYSINFHKTRQQQRRQQQQEEPGKGAVVGEGKADYKSLYFVTKIHLESISQKSWCDVSSVPITGPSGGW